MSARLAAVLSAVVLLLPAAARADQLQCNSAGAAEAAAARLAPGTIMLDFCSMCDAPVTVVRVSSAEVVKGCDFEVQVQGEVLAKTAKSFQDGKGVDGALYEPAQGTYDQRVDLAYVYVETAPNDFRWLGGVLGLDAQVNTPEIRLGEGAYEGLGEHRLVGTPRPDTPAADAVKQVWAYYYHGQGGAPVLADFVPCLEVDTEKGSETQYECTKPAEGPLPKGTKVSAWTAWLVPEGDKDTVMVQWVHDGIVRTTRDIEIAGTGFRYRTYSSKTLSKPGRWEIVILYGTTEIARKAVVVE